jgi:hypothetical protein
MMKFDRLIIESIQKTNLKKVRIKVDPANVSVAEDLAKCNGYEGYVLAEGQVATKIMVIIPDDTSTMPVIDVPNDCIQQLIQRPGSIELDKFKHFLINSLNVANDDPLITHIISCTSIDDIEAFLKDNGFTVDDITKLYKYYITYGE